MNQQISEINQEIDPIGTGEWSLKDEKQTRQANRSTGRGFQGKNTDLPQVQDTERMSREARMTRIYKGRVPERREMNRKVWRFEVPLKLSTEYWSPYVCEKLPEPEEKNTQNE